MNKVQDNTAVFVPADSAAGSLRLGPAAENWEKAVNHRFIKELFAGTIDDQLLRDYLIQDYQFFDAFLSMLGACVAHADSIAAKLRFSQQLGMLANDEDGYFLKAFQEFGVAEEEWLNPEYTRTTEAFAALMYDAVETRSYPHLLVMLCVAEWLYLDWGSQDMSWPERGVHRGWIALHTGKDFTDWVQFLVDELNRVFPQEDNLARELQLRWQKAVALELDFFEVCYE